MTTWLTCAAWRTTSKTIIGKLSKGFRQRVGIAQAILHEPEVLVLDEPTIGIDPIQVVETRSLIQDLGREQTVVLSSHILPEVSMICERVLIIHEGHIVAADTPNNLAQHLRGVAQLEVEIGGPAAGSAAGAPGHRRHYRGDAPPAPGRQRVPREVPGRAWTCATRFRARW